MATKTASPADVRERVATMGADLAAAEAQAEALRGDLGSAMVAGDEARAAAAQADLSAALATVERLKVGGAALADALADAQARADAAERAALVGEYAEALGAADAVLQAWLAAAGTLATFAPEMRATFGRAESLHRRLYPGTPGREDRAARPMLPYNLAGDVLGASLPGLHGGTFATRRGEESAAKLHDYVALFAPKE